MREAEIERWLGKRVPGMYLKFVSPGDAGVPDRILILPGGRIIFIELKTARGQLSPLQTYQILRLREMGAEVRVIRGMTEAEAFARELSAT